MKIPIPAPPPNPPPKRTMLTSVNIQLTTDQREALDAYAQQHSLSMAQAVRFAVDLLLSQATK